MVSTHEVFGSRPPSLLIPNAGPEVPKTTLRFFISLERLILKAVLLTVMVYHRKRYRFKSAERRGTWAESKVLNAKLPGILSWWRHGQC